MTKPVDIQVGNKTFTHVKGRLIGGQVFINHDKTEYLRTGSAAEIAGEVNLTKALHDRGFPTPEVIAEGTLADGTTYYIENAIGDRVFGDVFMDETKVHGQVRDETFADFLAVMKRYCAAQFNPENFVPHDIDALAGVVALANVLRNNPPTPEMRAPFLEAYKRASERVMSLPWGYIQADLNAFNILPNGVIDFELAGFGPIGYDVLTNVHFGRMWPEERVVYVFTDEQVASYSAEIDTVAAENGVPPLSEYHNDFMVLKAIWATGKDKESEDNPNDNPKFWQWRVNMRDWCIRQYLAREPIDSRLFASVSGT